MKKLIRYIPLFTISTVYAAVPNTQPTLDEQIQNALSAHYHQYQQMEHFSGISLSVYVPNQNIKNYYTGNISLSAKSQNVDKNTLFQIGSITKSFTAALILQLEKENKLKLTDNLKNWLPQYNKWGNITLTQLLNMTSGIPNYTESPLLNSQIYYNLSRSWTNTELIEFAYPPANFNPPLKSGFFYSNTNYILASMVIEKAAADSYEHELKSRLLQPAELNNTLYVLNRLEPKIQSRMAYGYYYDPYRLTEMVGKDIYEGNLSWAAGADGIISNSEDIIKWVKALFIGNKILDQNQKSQLMSLVSTNSGQAIAQSSASDPHGFGLGVAQNFEKEAGRFWFYEGETMGFRSIFMYQPCNGVIISAVVNSATNEENDHIGRLAQTVYRLILTQNPQWQCKEPSANPPATAFEQAKHEAKQSNSNL